MGVLPGVLLGAVLAVSAPAARAQGDTAVVTTPHVRAELVAQAPDGVAPGKPVWLGLSLTHQPEWHTYWKNAGDSGLPTRMEWTLPAGVTAGEIAWPVPHKIPVGNLANYGYEGTVLLPVPLTIAPDFKPGGVLGRDLEVKLQASWLVCRKECVPEEGSFTLKLPVASTTALHAAEFEQALAANPRPLAGAATVEVQGSAIRVSVQGLPATLRGKTLDFFPETAEVIETAAPMKQAWDGDRWTAEVPLSPQRTQSPAPMPIVVALGQQGWRADAKVTPGWPAPPAAPAAAAGVSPALEAALQANAQAGQAAAASSGPSGPPPSLWAALAGALLGGLILNLMPCVFPVLAIKVLGFARHAGDRRGHRIAGMAYSVGVVVSFLALGLLLVALRAAGEQLGWGFQLQSPLVVALLAGLFTLIGLNLAGVFEFGGLVPTRVATLEARHPVGNAFLSGVLAVAIASPCTAPFMGASLGFALGLPTAQAVAVFGAIGIGMALPYLAAAWVPAVARLLPRPGPWMEVFRRLMAFPMFATVAWLTWVLGQQAGIDGAAALLALLVALAMLAWALTLPGRSRVVVGAIAVAAFAGLAGWLGGSITRPPAAEGAQVAEGPWQPWSPQRVDALLASGRPVFVDFTAAWCVTCQINKKTTLERPEVMAALAAKNVALLRADWTRRDPQITEALAKLGRNGVPVYVFQARGKPARVLSEVLSVRDMQEAIGQL